MFFIQLMNFYKDDSFIGLLTNLLIVLMDKFLEFSLAEFFLNFPNFLHFFEIFKNTANESEL